MVKSPTTGAKQTNEKPPAGPSFAAIAQAGKAWNTKSTARYLFREKPSPKAPEAASNQSGASASTNVRGDESLKKAVE